MIVGRRYRGIVIPGNGRGKGLGFPTANIGLEENAPPDGVYSAWVRVAGGQWLGATVSVGDNPTFRNVETRRMESHIHDLDEDLYGKTVEVEIVAFLREMVAFNGADELISQTREDVVLSRSILSRTAAPAESIESGGR